jgi:hypothetical protein
VDDFSLGNYGNADFGGFLGNDRGIWIHSLSGSYGRASNLVAEHSAI